MKTLVVLSTLLYAASAGYSAAAGYAAPSAYGSYAAAPYAVRAVPYYAPAPSSQYQAQDEFGNVNYGYSNVNSQKHEVGNAYGGVTGSYSYVDPNGELQRVEYVADGLGFRVKATNLPVAPEAPAAPLPVAPAPVRKTPEVLEAEATFFQEYEAAQSRAKREAGYYGNAYGYGYSALTPVIANTPAATVKALPLARAYVAPVATVGYAYGNYGLGYGNHW